MQKRVVITGQGIVAPGGQNVHDFWNNILSGQSQIKPITRFPAAEIPVAVAGMVEDFDPLKHAISRQFRAQTDVVSQYAFVATKEALLDAALDPKNMGDPHLIGFQFGNNMGGSEFGEKELAKMYTAKDPGAIGPYQAIAWFYAATQGQITISYDMRGYGKTFVTECVASFDALNAGYRLIRNGVLNISLCGGGEAGIAPYGLVCYHASGWLSTSDGPPESVYRPLDRKATGMVMAEGSAMVVLEDLEHAQARGTRILAEVLGFGATMDASHMMKPSTDPGHYARAIREALASARLSEEEIDLVSPAGLGNVEYDRSEIEALMLALGPAAGRPFVSVPKSATGHGIAAAGAIDLVFALKAMQQEIIAPTLNLEEPVIQSPLRFVGQKPQPAQVRTALLLGRGMGGANRAMIIRRWEP
ncbi:MAG: beta-ketoacyl-[acyl-carrier-protein] synthase family protein [bacterium]